MATLRVFAGNMARLGDKIRANATKIQRATALAIDQTVVLATPVGDGKLWKHAPPKGYTGGRARGNWQVGIGAPVTSTLDAIDPGGQSTISAGAAAIDASTPGADIHITNNLPYIVPLNEGHSKQAPAGFIEIAIADGQEVVRNAKILE